MARFWPESHGASSHRTSASNGHDRAIDTRTPAPRSGQKPRSLDEVSVLMAIDPRTWGCGEANVTTSHRGAGEIWPHPAAVEVMAHVRGLHFPTSNPPDQQHLPPVSGQATVTRPFASSSTTARSSRAGVRRSIPVRLLVCPPGRRRPRSSRTSAGVLPRATLPRRTAFR